MWDNAGKDYWSTRRKKEEQMRSWTETYGYRIVVVPVLLLLFLILFYFRSNILLKLFPKTCVQTCDDVFFDRTKNCNSICEDFSNSKKLIFSSCVQACKAQFNGACNNVCANPSVLCTKSWSKEANEYCLHWTEIHGQIHAYKSCYEAIKRTMERVCLTVTNFYHTSEL